MVHSTRVRPDGGRVTSTRCGPSQGECPRTFTLKKSAAKPKGESRKRTMNSLKKDYSTKARCALRRQRPTGRRRVPRWWGRTYGHPVAGRQKKCHESMGRRIRQVATRMSMNASGWQRKTRPCVVRAGKISLLTGGREKGARGPSRRRGPVCQDTAPRDPVSPAPSL